MTNAPRKAFPARIPLLEFLLERGWKPVRDNGTDEVAGLCPLHRDTRPSFYVNRRKQVFYCHGCGCGGGLSRLARLLGDSADPSASLFAAPPSEQLLEDTYSFYQRSLVRSESAPAYLAARGIHDRALIERMRIGYAPGACLRGYLERLGYSRHELTACGLTDGQGRDCFFRCLTFPLPDAGNLYGRPINGCLYRHRFLPGSKGGLYGWTQAAAFAHVIVVEGLFDVAALWQAGFQNAVAALGSHLNNRQLTQLSQTTDRLIYICFDADRNGSGQRAAHRLSVQLRHAGLDALRVELPLGHDPASFLAAGATACDFRHRLERARP
jgi:DNA primase